ncbi:MAG: glycosyl hydrolase family 8 [Bacteroidales bacterium]|nr:glycosyl hydrolase family 8 [Bacteroidales bacterium]
MKKVFLSIFSIAISIVSFAQQFPFPMNKQGYSYQNGIVASIPDNEKIQSRFISWDKTMYKESSDGQYGRIRFDDNRYTVSEGIGYGMLIYVYMSSEENDFCQDRFDKLYAYYKKWSNGNGVMNWKIEGFEKVNGYNGASDADLDVALALCLAAKQWGYSSNYAYADEAEYLLNAIYKKEVGTHSVDGKMLTLINPGDSWNSIGNACYFTVASMGVYSQTQKYFNFSKKNDWETVYNDSHIFLEKSQRNGLWPNWSNWDGTPCDRSPYDETSMDFGWDACRTPWRIAWDYLWYGNESSKKMMDKTVEMMTANGLLDNPGKAGLYTDLDAESYTEIKYKGLGGTSAFMGSFACALMTDESKQEALDLYHEKLKSKSESPYYSPTLQILYLLVTSGNAANFYELEACAPQIVVNPTVSAASTDGNVLEISCSKEMDETKTDFSNFILYVNGKEVPEAFSSMTVSGTTISLSLQNIEVSQDMILAVSYSGETVVSKQGGVLGASIKYPVTNHVFEVGGNTILADCENQSGTTLGGGWYSYSDADSKQSYKLVEGGANDTKTSAHFAFEEVKAYAGVGFNILPFENPLDCSGSTGISFYHKGDACVLEAKSVTKRNANYSYQTYEISAHEDWTLVELAWEDIAEDFVTSGYVTEVTGFQWKEIVGSGSFYIDEVVLVGRSISTSVMDRVNIEASLIEANNLFAKATIEKYPQSAIDEFAEVIAAAAEKNMDVNAARSDLDSVNIVLTTAISDFKSKAYGDKTALLKNIKSATALSSEATIGSGKNEYPQAAKDLLDEAIAKAQESYDTFGLAVSEVSEALAALQQAVTDFNKSKITTGVQGMNLVLNVYPNPCKENLFVESMEEISFVQIIGMDGTCSLVELNQSCAQISMANLKKGYYLLSVFFANGTSSTTKIIKE